MGIQGLVTFMDAHSQIYRDVQFKNRRLVIDGSNLLHHLYYKSGLDQRHGGEYAAFEDLIEKFVGALNECGVEPYVVLDGGSDHTDKKLQTLMDRAKDRIRRAHEAAMGQEKDILPPLTKLVFKQTLARLEVKLVQCFGEADEQIAALASEWKCPVLSADSDFYIFNLPGGLLPIPHFQWGALEKTGSQSYIPCKSYNISSFCTFFDIQQQVLPVFAALAGNDYVNLQKMKLFLNWAQFDPDYRPTERPTRQEKLKGLLCWLKNFQRDQEALEAALQLKRDLSSEERAAVLKGLNLAMTEYKILPCYLKQFLIHGIAPPLPLVEVFNQVPDWVRLPLVQGRLSPDILDILLLQRMYLSYPIEPEHLPSSQQTSQPIRQVMYGLLLGSQVEEFDRDRLELKSTMVQPVCRGAAQQLQLNSLHKEKQEVRLKVFLDTLEVTESCVSALPPQLQLPVAVTCYWLQKAQPPLLLINALLLLMTTDSSTLTAAVQADRDDGVDVDMDVAHSFNQWQLCLKDAVHLNQLLLCPLPEPHIAPLYQGTLLHQLLRHVRNNPSSLQPEPDLLDTVLQFHNPSAGTTRTRRQSMDGPIASLEQLSLLSENEEAVAAARAEEDVAGLDLVTVRTRHRSKERGNRSMRKS
ncbi:hypothetical protein LDENG_00033370 [Lucifuga dentata]|nr:hypothetical protein LDENG_00033370 [Lucifuga dentata]